MSWLNNGISMHIDFKCYVFTTKKKKTFRNEPKHEIHINVVSTSSKASDQPAHKSFRLLLEYSMTNKLLTEQHLKFLSLKVGCTGSPESITCLIAT